MFFKWNSSLEIFFMWFKNLFFFHNDIYYKEISFFNDFNKCALQLAVEKGNDDIVKILLQNSMIDVNSKSI